jgi:hypothetical protein
MKKFVLALAVCCTFSVYVTAIDTNDSRMEEYTLRTLIENDTNNIEEVVRNGCAEADKASFEADKAYYKATIKFIQSRKVLATKANLLKMYNTKADKARDEAYETYCEARAATPDHDSRAKVEELSALYDTASANTAKAYGILCKTATEINKSNNNEAIRLYNRAAKFYDKTARAYGEIVVAYSINTHILRTIAEKAKCTKEYARYEAHVAKKGEGLEAWAKMQIYYEKMKKISEAYAKTIAIFVELHEAAKTYARAAETYVKAAETHAKAVKNSIELPEADTISCYNVKDAVELHKAHKISDAQLAAVSQFKASSKTEAAYAAYCRTKLKLVEAIAAVLCEEDEAVKLRIELNKYTVKLCQDTLQRQAEFISCY